MRNKKTSLVMPTTLVIMSLIIGFKQHSFYNSAISVWLIGLLKIVVNKHLYREIATSICLDCFDCFILNDPRKNHQFNRSCRF